MISCLILVPFFLLTIWAIDVYIESKRAKEDPYPEYLKLVNKKPTKK